MKAKHSLALNEKGFLSIYALFLLYLTIVCISIQYGRVKTYSYVKKASIQQQDIFILQNIKNELLNKSNEELKSFTKSYKDTLISFQFLESKYIVQCSNTPVQMIVYLNEDHAYISDYDYIN